MCIYIYMYGVTIGIIWGHTGTILGKYRGKDLEATM